MSFERLIGTQFRDDRGQGKFAKLLVADQHESTLQVADRLSARVYLMPCHLPLDTLLASFVPERPWRLVRRACPLAPLLRA